METRKINKRHKSGTVRKGPGGDVPDIDPSTWIDPAAVIIGNVRILKNVFIAPGAVVRADEPGSSVLIGENCNVQDRVIVHSLSDCKVIIGDSTSLSHGSIVHGPCVIGKNCFIGFGSIVFRSKLTDGVFVGSSAVVTGVNIPPGKSVPAGMVIDTPEKAEQLVDASEMDQEFSRAIVKANQYLLRTYLNS